MKELTIGDQAPSFAAPTVYGDNFELSGALEKGEKVFLAFHRYATCPICNFSLRQFEKGYQELLDKGIRYVPIFHSNIESMQEAYPEKPAFEIISDPEMTLYKDYGLNPSISAFFHPKAILDAGKALNSIFQPGYKFKLAPENSFLTKPADFLINEDGKILYARYGASVGDSTSFQETLKLA
jgi:peroxiredoxin